MLLTIAIETLITTSDVITYIGAHNRIVIEWNINRLDGIKAKDIKFDKEKLLSILQPLSARHHP